MNWFDEQLRFREEADNENFSAAIDSIAGAVMGSRLTKALSDRELAASAMEEILKYFRLRPTREEAPAPDASAEEQLEERMRPHGIEFRTVKLEGDWYRHAVGPMLGTLREDGAAVALIPGKLSGYSYLDLRTGRRVRLNRRTAKELDTEASCFYQSLPRRAIGVRDLLRFMVGQLSAADVGLYFLLMALAALLGLLSPMFTKWLFGAVLESGSGRVLLALAVFMVSYSLCRILFTTYQGLVNSRVGVKMDVAVEAAVMSRLIHLPAAFFRGYASGELSQRANNVQNLCKMMFSTLGITGLSSVFSLVYLGQIFAFAPAMVAPALGITLCSAAISLITTFIQRGISRELMEQAGKNSGLTYATITGIRKIKLAGAEKRMFARWAKTYAEELRLQYNSPAFLKLRSAITLAVSLGGSLLLYYAAIRNRVGVADYYAFNAAYGMVSGAFASIASIATTLADIRPTLDMARPILEAEPEACEGLERVTKLRGAIELSHVSFRYDEVMPYVIDDLSLKIRPGEYVAVVGATGCGKSTLMRLLLGFEKPQKGSIFFDRYEVSRVEPESLRRCIGAVMQDGKLFPGDIYSNIVITAPRLTLDEAWQAAEIAAIAEDIREMPMGMHTVISEGQGGISGGQRQRLEIARAVAPKPNILLFDEATSALDNVTQRKVSEAIDGLKCTRMVIAHRLSTIRHADRILYLEGGRIAEEGTYEELIALNGRFAALVSRQRLDIDAE